MADLFSIYERSGSYDKRLRKLLEEGRKKITEADHKAIASLREDRSRLLELVGRFSRLRKVQKERDRAADIGVSKAQGLELLIFEADQLQRAVDTEIERTLAEIQKNANDQEPTGGDESTGGGESPVNQPGGVGAGPEGDELPSWLSYRSSE